MTMNRCVSRCVIAVALIASAMLGGCRTSSERVEPGQRFSVGANPRVAASPEPAEGFRVVQRYLSHGNQIFTAETLLIEPIVPHGEHSYQVLVGPARDGSRLDAQVRNSAATLVMNSGFAAATGHQPIVVIKRVVAAADGTTFIVEGSRSGVYICVLNAAADKPVRVYFDGDDASRSVRVDNWHYVRIPEHATRIPPAQRIPFPGTALADPDEVGGLLQYSHAKRVQTGQAILPGDADAHYVSLLRR